MKRIVVCTVAALVVASSTLPAAAWDRWSPGAAVAVGAVSGLALGAAIGSAATPYYPGKPVYVAAPPPRRVYVETVEEAPVCTVRRQRTVDEFGDVTIRRVRVCE
jgi:hypothetical protein